MLIPPVIDFDSLPEPVRQYIRFLEATVQQLQTQVQQLQTQVSDLEARLNKNSSNSSKPPSSDGLKRKPKSQRISSGKNPGGQEGHIGKNLMQVEDPDHIVIHTPINCKECGAHLDKVKGFCVEIRQVFDIPQPTVEITEHRVEEKECPYCKHTARASFPENVRGPVQYGERVQALAVYFSHQHFIPVERVCQLFEDVFGVTISPGTCSNVDERLFQKLESFETNLKAYLLATQILHFDETGMRCAKKLHWVHVVASSEATAYTIHAKRGREAMEAMGILPDFVGTAIHDHWFPYFSFEQTKHGLCNAHHLRELTFVEEEQKEDWAKQMKNLLIFSKTQVEQNWEQGRLSAEMLLQIEQEYDRICGSGILYHEQLPPLSKPKRGKQKQRDGKNFLDRLKGKKDCILRFAHNFSVPFTNNAGERAIRMVKLKQKIGGCFRTLKGGQIFCRIRSYIATGRKQSWNIWDALAEAIKGSPRLLVFDPTI